MLENNNNQVVVSSFASIKIGRNPPTQKRRHSLYNINGFFQDSLTGNPINTLNTLEFKQDLGNGRFGLVKEFCDSSNLLSPFAIKYIQHAPYHTEDDIKKEYELIKLAYPAYISFFISTDDGFRLGMKKFPGKCLHIILEEYPQYSDVVIKTTTIELLRLHSLGIIHGDIKADNILVNLQEDGTCQVFFVDFGCSYFISDNIANYTKENCHYWAPERTNLHNRSFCPKPSFAQDIFSFSMMLNDLIFLTPDFVISAPEHMHWCLSALNPALYRPNLIEFLQSLAAPNLFCSEQIDIMQQNFHSFASYFLSESQRIFISRAIMKLIFSGNQNELICTNQAYIHIQNITKDKTIYPNLINNHTLIDWYFTLLKLHIFTPKPAISEAHFQSIIAETLQYQQMADPVNTTLMSHCVFFPYSPQTKASLTSSMTMNANI